MNRSYIRWSAATLALGVLVSCGGGGSSDTAPPPATDGQPTTVKEALAAAAAVGTNDTASSTSASFSVLQAAGVPAVTVNSPPRVNFAVFSDGAVKTGLVITNVSAAIAKLVPGTNGDPDEWKSYTYRLRTAATASATGVYTDAVRATLTNPAFPSAVQATTDPKQTDPALLAAQLVYNPDGYYTYTFRTNITDPAWTATVNNVAYSTNGVTFEKGLTHRVALQLSYVNAAGETVRVNPYFDFTVDDNGNAVPVTDPTKTRKMTDVQSCNGCHEKLALHGGGRVDTQYCVMCHNPSTVDANSGNNLNLSTMVHKIHSAKLLRSQAATGGGEIYTVRTDDFSEVGFPQDLRNCTKCHSGANTSTPQGDNWKTAPSKQACLTCHANKVGSTWEASHKVYARDPAVNPGALGTEAATALTNKMCVDCHKVGSNISPERVHWNQNEENAAKYKMNIESATYDAVARKVTVKYYLSDPTDATNAAYNLVTSDCTGTTTITCANTTRFGNLRFYLAYQNMIGQSTAVTEFSAYNNGGSSANAYAYKGVNDGNNHYTVDIALPADTATAVAAGTARVVSIGQIKEPKLQAKAATDPRPEVVPRVLINTVVQHTYQELALTGTLVPRRTIVSTAKCNVCHGALGTTSGSNTLAEAFHGGGRDIVEACVVCHDANRASSTVMTNGLSLNESYQFKRMIHGIHGNSRRTHPFTHGNTVLDAFNKDGTSTTAGRPALSAQTNPNTGAAISVENYAAEVAWPGVGLNCNACHVNNSYKQDLGPLGAAVLKNGATTAGPVVFMPPTFSPAPANPTVTDPALWMVISPKAASCTACHDSPKAMGHVTSFGGSAFGDKTQGQIAGLARETCDDCHSSGGFKGVDLVHGQK